jgi:hypothetical protein
MRCRGGESLSTIKLQAEVENREIGLSGKHGKQMNLEENDGLTVTGLNIRRILRKLEVEMRPVCY